MLHIFRADNNEERSLHAETREGLANARAEAWLRSSSTGAVHHVVNDEGQVVAIMDANYKPKEKLVADARTEVDGTLRVGKKPLTVIPITVFLWAALVAAVVIFRAVFGKEVF